MAKRIEVVLVDDLDGDEASETVTFGIDGSNFEIDLSEVNAGSLRETLKPYVAAARRVTNGTRRAGRRR